MHVAQHRQVAVGRLQVLADGQHVHVVGAHVAHHVQDFLVGLAQANHQAGLGADVGILRLVVLEQLQRVRVVGARAGLLVQARHGFQVVVHHVRRGAAEDVDGDVQAAAEVGHQGFDLSAGRGCAHRVDAVGEVLGAAVAQVVAVHRGHHHVLQPHRRHTFGQVLGLVGVQRVGAAVADVAERAAAGADVAHDHEGGGALAEAFADIGAGGFFAHGVQLLIAQDLLDFVEALAIGQLGADPLRLSQLFVQRHDLDRDAGGLGRALVLHPGLVVRLHAVSLLVRRWRSRCGSSLSAASATVRFTPRFFIWVTLRLA